MSEQENCDKNGWTGLAGMKAVGHRQGETVVDGVIEQRYWIAPD